MVQQLIQRVEREIQPQLQLFLTSIADGTIDSDLKDDYHMLIYQVPAHAIPLHSTTLKLPIV